MKKKLLFPLFFFVSLLSFGQEACIPNITGLNTYDKGNNYWKAYVYQLDAGYTGETDSDRNFPSSSATYKGMLPYRNGFLPHNASNERIYVHNFDINFGDNGGFSTDANYFSSQNRYDKPNILGCPVQLQNFGVIFRTKINITETGIYKITVGSDDGSFLKDGEDIIHDNWGAGKTYNYGENIFNHYRAYEAGQELNFDLSYFEKNGYNRVSFNFVKYLGPGEIDGSQEVCGIAPDPVAFGSRGPAAFAVGGTENISYQWQYYDETNDQWTDVNGANSLTYKVPRYDQSEPERNWTGKRRYRRMAILSLNEADPTSTPSNEVEVTIYPPIDNLDQQEFGVNEWIGHVYRGKGVFTDDTYAGRTEDADPNFRHTFGNEGMDAHRFNLAYGCYIVTTNFSVRYKMKLAVVPDTYKFKVFGDDGFRLYVNGHEIINKWEGSQGERLADYVVEEAGELELVLEYYEGRGRSEIDFSYTSLILPLEWGEVNAKACGAANCLTWETIQEKNTSHFELERSYDGIDWEMFDSSVRAQGNSTEKVNYAFSDQEFMASKVYYRIRQVDLDGAFDYSEVMRVDNPYYSKGFLPFPNPTVEKILFYSPKEVVKLFIISNDLAIHAQLEPDKLQDNRYEVNLSGYRPGAYVILVQTKDGEKQVFKVIKK